MMEDPVKKTYDPGFKGPVQSRSTTDVIWLILFIIFLGIWAYVGWYGTTHGQIQKILAPKNSEGGHCGVDPGLEDLGFVAFFDITKCLGMGMGMLIAGCPTPKVCVRQCPSETVIFNTLSENQFIQYRSNMICNHGINVNELTLEQASTHIKNRQCASYVINSKPLLQRCIPKIPLNKIKELIPDLFNQTQNLIKEVPHQKELKNILSDFMLLKWSLLQALGAIVVICVVYIFFLRWSVGPIVWTTIAMFIGGLSFLVLLCYMNYVYYRDNPQKELPRASFVDTLRSTLADKNTWLGLTIAIGVILGILLLVIIFLRNRIIIAIALIREGSKAVSAVKTTLFFPIIPWIIHWLLILCTVYVALSLYSIEENISNDTSCNCGGSNSTDGKDCNFMELGERCHNNRGGIYIVLTLHAANIFCFYWAHYFVRGIVDMILANTFSTWYWTYTKRDLPFFTLTHGVACTVRIISEHHADEVGWNITYYHLGTVALGSLLLALLRIIRFILYTVSRSLKKYENPVVRCLICCIKCFMKCLEKLLKLLNKNAYIMTAIYGYGYCKSVSAAFSLIIRNAVRVVVLDKVTNFVFFLSKALITIGVGVATYYLLQWDSANEWTHGQQVNYIVIPAIVLAVATYFICTVFFKVYEMAVDTLFLCFLEDCERNDGSPDKPYYMSKNLMSILGKQNK